MLAGATMTSRGRFATVSAAATCLTGDEDLSHAWDGWLYTLLVACATWPIFHALGIFT